MSKKSTHAAAIAEESSALREASISKLTAGELASWISAGSGEVASALAAVSITGADLKWLIEAKRGPGTPLKGADGTSAWSSTAEPRVLSLVASRGEDGQIGLTIRDDFALAIFNVVVGIMPGSRAAADGLFQLGDVILEVDDVPLVPDDDALPTLEVRHVMQRQHKASYRFKVLRAVDAPRSEQAAAAHEPRVGGLQRIAAAAAPPAGAPPAAAAPPSPPLPPKRPKLNLAAVSPPSDDAPPLALAGGEAPLFSADTPRSLIFAHAAALKRKHLTLARARRSSLPPPSPPREAERACDALASQPAALDPDISLTLRHEGRPVDDWGLCV